MKIRRRFVARTAVATSLLARHPAQPKGCTCTNHRGFSLLEALCVLAIMAILGMLVYPTYLDVTRKAKRAEARASLMQIMQQQERYYASHQTYSAFSRTAPNGFKWFSGNNPVTSAYEISGEACGNDPLEACVRLVARAGTPYVSRGYRDDACRELTFTSTGVQAAVGNGDCW